MVGMRSRQLLKERFDLRPIRCRTHIIPPIQIERGTQ
jgi:hypothetical protein